MKEYFLLLIIFQLFYFTLLQDRLVFLYTHFRHGARAPQRIGDNFYDMLGEFWNTPGELTGVGQRMQYILGLRNREKYIKKEKFLSETYDAHEILIHSTNYNRTMVSCSSQLQGFYPIREQLGYNLTQEQKEIAYPPGNISQEIQNAVDEIESVALPYQMTLIPIRMISDNDREMNIGEIKECTEENNAIFSQNSQNVQELKDVVKNFNGKYAESLNKYFNKETASFDGVELDDICDAFLSNYVDKREMKEFKAKSGLDFDIFKEDCFNYTGDLFIYGYYGDEEKTLAHLESSKLLRKELYYMKRRLDADISAENEDANLKDFSRPKMLMMSAHDYTVTSDIVLLLYSLGLNISELYHFPRYASQLALEVRTSKSKCSSYSDYYVLGLHDEDELFNINAQEFIDKMERNLWSDEKINNFCGFDSDYNITINDEDKKDNAKTAYKVLMSVFICLSAILLATTILFGYKYSKASKSMPPIDQQVNYNPTNTTNISTK